MKDTELFRGSNGEINASKISFEAFIKTKNKENELLNIIKSLELRLEILEKKLERIL